MKDSLSELRRKARFRRSRYSLERILKASVDGSASSVANESPSVTRKVAKNIWSPGGSEIRNVSGIERAFLFLNVHGSNDTRKSRLEIPVASRVLSISDPLEVEIVFRDRYRIVNSAIFGIRSA